MSARTSRRTCLRCEPLEDRRTPATLPPGFSETNLGAVSAPTSLAVAPDGRLFVTEQTGAVRVVRNGAVLPTPFLSLTVDSSGERGLLGLAFDPNFAVNGFVYVYYTVPGPGAAPEHNRISRFTASGDVVVPGSEFVLVDLENLSGATNHNGGAMHFGLDGKLYVAVGENASPNLAQSLNSRFGKMLRYNPDGTIPTDNPFFATATGGNRAIWALGLRNPFTFEIQPGTGRIFINDVGQSTFEEINDGVAGGNYGWPAEEGPSTDPNFISPLLAYGHGNGPDVGIAVTGGTFYNPATATFPPEFVGDYFYADLGSGWVRRFDPVSKQSLAFGADFGNPVDLDVDAQGNLYVLTRSGGGSVRRVAFTAGTGPTIVREPADLLVSVVQSATFSVEASGTAPLSYQWQRNGANIPGATGTSFTIPNPTLADSGDRFRVVVSNAFGSVTSASATLTVTDDLPPRATLTLDPPATQLFVAGSEIRYSGAGTDPETGALPPSAFTFRVDYHTGAIARPFVQPVSGVTSGSFVIPTQTPYTAADVFFRVWLTVVDPRGLTTTVFQDVLPRTATMSFFANVPGAVRLDGQPLASPDVVGVAGIRRTVEALPGVVVDGRLWLFAGWAHGAPRVFELSTPTADTTFTATYRPAPFLAAGAGTGGPPVVRLFDPLTRDLVGERMAFDAAFRGGVRVAQGDVNGDGVPDLVAAPGPGGGPFVRVFDGGTGQLLWERLVFEESFRGGLFVTAADFDGDGRADVAVSPDEGGGPRVRIFTSDGAGQIADFFGIEDPAFRGGARVAAGDLNGDGRADLLVGAGFGGGPRVAGFDGTTLRSIAVKLFADFFVFEETLRNGVFLTAGDLNADGRADLTFGAGPGGGPRVFALDGPRFVASGGSDRAPLANFFAGDANLRGGVRLTASRVDVDATADLLTNVPGDGSTVGVFAGAVIPPDGAVEPVERFNAFDAPIGGGVFVG